MIDRSKIIGEIRLTIAVLKPTCWSKRIVAGSNFLNRKVGKDGKNFFPVSPFFLFISFESRLFAAAEPRFPSAVLESGRSLCLDLLFSCAHLHVANSDWSHG